MLMPLRRHALFATLRAHTRLLLPLPARYCCMLLLCLLLRASLLRYFAMLAMFIRRPALQRAATCTMSLMPMPLMPR